MACNYPIQAYRIGSSYKEKSEIVFQLKDGMNVLSDFKVPCGKCNGCRLERSRQWAVRCVCEAKSHEENVFVTLTYNDENLPDLNSLDYRDFQLFMKRLRKNTGKKIRYFVAGEYGDEKKRPHFHACLFGFRFRDIKYFKKTKSGCDIYTSESLDKLWGKGFCTVGELTFESAAYTARYIMKKVANGDISCYDEIDLETGEVYQKEKEFCHMSLKPGIGAKFYEKYKSEIFPLDRVVMRGKEQKPPQYFFKKLKQEDEKLYGEIADNRERKAIRYQRDNGEDRRMVKEAVLEAKLNRFKRNVDE